jgi:hypothetical protein
MAAASARPVGVYSGFWGEVLADLPGSRFGDCRSEQTLCFFSDFNCRVGFQPLSHVEIGTLQLRRPLDPSPSPSASSFEN